MKHNIDIDNHGSKSNSIEPGLSSTITVLAPCSHLASHCQCISLSFRSYQLSNFPSMLNVIMFICQIIGFQHSQAHGSARVAGGSHLPYRPWSLQTFPPPSQVPSPLAACPCRPFGCCCPHSLLHPPVHLRAFCSCVLHRASARCSSALIQGARGLCAHRPRLLR